MILKRRLIEQKKSPDIIVLRKKPDAALEHLDRFAHRVSGTVD
jgi:hypothetical protein